MRRYFLLKRADMVWWWKLCSMKKLKVYVGCALAYSPEEYKKEVYSFKEELSKIPWIHLFEFCKPSPGKTQSDLDPGFIYYNDIIEGVGGSDVVIGELSYPSTGLGGELMSAMKDNTRTMMFAKEGIIVSKLWVGAPTYNANASFSWYKESFLEILPQLLIELQTIYSKI